MLRKFQESKLILVVRMAFTSKPPHHPCGNRLSRPCDGRITLDSVFHMGSGRSGDK